MQYSPTVQMSSLRQVGMALHADTDELHREINENSAIRGYFNPKIIIFAVETASFPMNNDVEFRLYEGAPSAEEECTEMEHKVYDFLKKVGVNHKTLKHPPAFTIEECQKVRERVKAPVFKNLFLTNKQQTKFYLLLMPGEKIFKTKYLSAQINSARLSFATPDHMQQMLGVTPGSVTPLGLINDKNLMVNLLLDRDILNYTEFACHPCINTASVVMKLEDFLEKVIPATDHQFQWVELPVE